MPAHTAAGPLIVIIGKAFTVSRTVAESRHPLASETVSVYVLVEEAVAVGLATEVLLRPVAGDQEYVPPPEPLSTAPDPLHSETAGPGFAVGRWFTVTAAVATPVHPFPSFAVTV